MTQLRFRGELSLWFGGSDGRQRWFDSSCVGRCQVMPGLSQVLDLQPVDQR